MFIFSEKNIISETTEGKEERREKLMGQPSTSPGVCGAFWLPTYLLDI
jgi:hypothetical protein